jgi:hypothetical protein
VGVHGIGRRAVGSLAAVGLMAVAGCGSATPLPDPIPSTATVCAARGFSVAVDLDGVRATNTSGSTCVFSGRYPVEMHVWQLEGAGPPPAVGELAAGATYVQPYIAGAGNGCPAVRRGVARLAVQVEGQPIVITLDAQRVHEIQDCISFTAGRPRIEP